MPRELVLVTGGSGFIAGHCVLRLVERGYRVRTTVRSLAKEAGVRRVLADAGLPDQEPLTFVEADLTDDAGWDAAVAGCDFVLHVASPVHLARVKDENDVIGPAREGTLRVLRAAREAGVRRVVLTSAFHAVGFGQPHTDHVFTEEDWSPLDGPGMDAYGKSKILAERAAWEYVEGGPMELVTMLPVAVMGPVMGRDVSGANHIVQNILNGSLRALPNLYIPIVDVRDVATAHVEAMTAAGAAGQRILVATGEPAMAMRQIGAVLREHLGPAAGKVTTRTVPDLVVRLASVLNPTLRSPASDLGFVKQVSTERLVRLLGLHPRPAEEAILAAAESLIARSLV